jgi:hypothetical protein
MVWFGLVWFGMVWFGLLLLICEAWLALNIGVPELGSGLVYGWTLRW